MATHLFKSVTYPRRDTRLTVVSAVLCTIIIPFTGEPEMLGGSVKVCTMGIEGMTCHSCVSLIESTVGEMKGVVKVTVSLAERQGTVKYDSELVTPEEIKNTVKDMGFIVAGVTGMYFQFICIVKQNRRETARLRYVVFCLLK